ncbi:hypothetical protein MJO28_000726 [Puccinia striiformis f. sp. tritici]|uniref:Uncharacterized protein n=1 Tax=Puccinia striiformis f. sp. tritici TaxID=168172 RepID=A0ACC0EYT2_9BASI|nr:hypothetical protein MJO28_000726 [Puccinia striiformis f. sp. tritici]KAI7967245.1 hypothetical protein MJO29_000522 [Puccinia striiformis f. sp. tritici]
MTCKKAVKADAGTSLARATLTVGGPTNESILRALTDVSSRRWSGEQLDDQVRRNPTKVDRRTPGKRSSWSSDTVAKISSKLYS